MWRDSARRGVEPPPPLTPAHPPPLTPTRPFLLPFLCSSVPPQHPGAAGQLRAGAAAPPAAYTPLSHALGHRSPSAQEASCSPPAAPAPSSPSPAAPPAAPPQHPLATGLGGGNRWQRRFRLRRDPLFRQAVNPPCESSGRALSPAVNEPCESVKNQKRHGDGSRPLVVEALFNLRWQRASSRPDPLVGLRDRSLWRGG